MIKNPVVNALAASLYIVGIVSLISYLGTSQVEEDTILAPIAMISLLTLSVAVMGYLFAYQPLALFLEDKKQEAVNFFLQTVGIFAAITALVFIAMISGLFSEMLSGFEV